ncbi:hypothetical protein RISK_005603 [Rhodopirellula islandica]|uniref:Uncharacterized protein n=1 Tax=Rhodopirellula islandica TaxID=595434 RepID=A0A0J1B724_RHOIS|nr:hypothetical protein RISK_005603 [Rhodopirellula islandica]
MKGIISSQKTRNCNPVGYVQQRFAAKSGLYSMDLLATRVSVKSKTAPPIRRFTTSAGFTTQDKP